VAVSEKIQAEVTIERGKGKGREVKARKRRFEGTGKARGWRQGVGR
jgi:hypothetical protein